MGNQYEDIWNNIDIGTKLVDSIIKEAAHGRTLCEKLGMGIGGMVYKVERDNKAYVVKFIPNKPPVPFERESADDRVYDSRPSEFSAAYKIMRKADLPLPNIYAQDITSNGSYVYIVMDYLPGESIREFMVERSDKDDNFHEVVGETCAELHTITRKYQGWVSMDKPYRISWGEAFFTSLQNRLQYVIEKSWLDHTTVAKLLTKIYEARKSWDEPREFVLSHTDGFQGIASKKDGLWSVDGIIDIEDHQFTDQRFVLTGHELAFECEDKRLPDEFWTAYSKIKTIDPTFAAHREIFKLYYLLVWLSVFKNHIIGDISNREDRAGRMVKMINYII